MSREKPRLGKEFRLRRKRELLTALSRNARQSFWDPIAVATCKFWGTSPCVSAAKAATKKGQRTAP